jgi:hypothetical protein
MSNPSSSEAGARSPGILEVPVFKSLRREKSRQNLSATFPWNRRDPSPSPAQRPIPKYKHGKGSKRLSST